MHLCDHYFACFHSSWFLRCLSPSFIGSIVFCFLVSLDFVCSDQLGRWQVLPNWVLGVIMPCVDGGVGWLQCWLGSLGPSVLGLPSHCGQRPGPSQHTSPRERPVGARAAGVAWAICPGLCCGKSTAVCVGWRGSAPLSTR